MDDEDIPIERRSYARVPLTRSVTFSVTMRAEIETLQNAQGAEFSAPTYEISATINLRRSGSDQPVSYDLNATMTPREPREREHSATTKNIGQGGLCIVTPSRLQEHQVIRIGIPIPESELTTPTLAEVRWCREEGGAVRAGLKYLL